MLFDTNILMRAIVNFVTSKSRVSAVIIATQKRRHVVLQKLIGLGVDLSLRDGKKCSPLFYASRNGDLEAVKLLVQAQARPDDGSLHEAAREAHPEIVSYLLAHDHHVDFPSSQHSNGVSGRTALEELCSRGTPDGDAWETRVHRTIELLLPVSGEPMMKSDGKSLLHYAIDNENGLEATEALLQFAPIWERINDPIHLYEDAIGIIYSPTQYVEHFYEGSIAMRNKLIQLLRGKKCQDRYYSQTIQQPVGALGLPDEISAAIKRQQNADRELEEELKRQDKLVEHQQKLQNLNHQNSQRISAEQHGQSMKQLHSHEAFTRRMTQQKHTLSIAHHRELALENRHTLQEDAKLRMKITQDESVQRKAITDSEHTTEINHRQKLIMQDHQADEARIGRQRHLMRDEEGVMQRQHDRQIKLIGRQEESVKFKAREIMATAKAARDLNAGNAANAILQIGNNDGLD
jgi:ankyrin repeat domain-containing protein 50